MKRAGVIAPGGPGKAGSDRQVRTKSFHSLRPTLISRLANADVSRDARKAFASTRAATLMLLQERFKIGCHSEPSEESRPILSILISEIPRSARNDKARDAL
jgi:hypothetical protein